MSLGLVGSLLSPASYSGLGRGDFHTAYQGESVDDLIIKFMEKNNIPGLSLAIVQAPYITRIVGYGLADTQTKRLVASHTVFNVGQLTNAYTAVAVMQLKEEGKLSLEDPITKFIPHIPKSWHTITLRELMTHSSGLPSYFEVSDFHPEKEYNQDQILNLVKNQNLLFEPGTSVNNSATDNFLLGMVIEKASGLSYQEYVTKNQFERLGLKHTFFISTLDKMKNEVDNGSQPFKHSQFLHETTYINPTEAAVGYAENNGTLETVKLSSFSAAFSHSAVMSSAEDISFWDIGLAGDILVKDPKNREFLYHPIQLKNGKSIPGNVGWLFPGHPGLMEIKGNVPGYSSFLSRFTAPSELLCVTLLVNKEDVTNLDILARQIAAAFDTKLGAPNGAAWVETLQSPYSVEETLDRVENLVKQQGGKVFARIDHSTEAAETQQTLPPTEVLIIGNPAVGTDLMLADPAMALDLPLRVMARKDDTGQVWLSFTDPLKLAMEYSGDKQKIALLRKMSNVLHKTCQKAVSPNSIKPTQ
ncbi:MAG: peptidase [Gammaproteobacteria bacterium 39-13]|nr:MAG: peptidase [Gammaproteobacteria bacterium 39-13]